MYIYIYTCIYTYIHIYIYSMHVHIHVYRHMKITCIYGRHTHIYTYITSTIHLDSAGVRGCSTRDGQVGEQGAEVFRGLGSGVAASAITNVVVSYLEDGYSAILNTARNDMDAQLGLLY